MKNTKKKLNNQSKVVQASFQQVDVASSLSRTQSSLVLHSFIASFPGSNITSSGHQIELKMYEHHFYKADWEELDRLIEVA